jgi:hypothetical protein
MFDLQQLRIEIARTTSCPTRTYSKNEQLAARLREHFAGLTVCGVGPPWAFLSDLGRWRSASGPFYPQGLPGGIAGVPRGGE